MPVVHARRLCPRAVFLHPDFESYSFFSARMFAIMEAYSPLVQATSVDEGYIDLTGTLRLHKAPAWDIAHRILCRIRSTLGINVSGVGFQPMLGKVGYGDSQAERAIVPGVSERYDLLGKASCE